MMLPIWISVGAVIWIATITASGAINYLAGYQFGRSPEESQVFALLGVSADAWKAIGPIFIVTLWRGSRRLATGFAAAVWIVCFTFAMLAALGLAAETRSAFTGGRESLKLSYTIAAKELSKTEHQRSQIGAALSPPEIQSSIEVVLARAVDSRGTVASLSNSCRKDSWRTRTACEEIAKLRQDLAKAREAQRLDERILHLKSEAQRLRDHGGLLESDPQAKLISRLSFGSIASEDVGLSVVLLLVIMVELISAFAPVVLSETAAVHRANRARVMIGTGQPQSDALHVGSQADPLKIVDIYEYLSAQIRPDTKSSVSAKLLFNDYKMWCAARGFSEIDRKQFFTSFDMIIKHDMAGHVQRRGSNYFGFRLIAVRRSKS